MRAIGIALMRIMLFWLVFFAIHRLFFLIYHLDLIRLEDIRFQEGLNTFVAAFSLDISTAAYLSLVPFLLLLLRSQLSKIVVDRGMQLYMLLTIVLYTIVSLAEVGLYAEWKTKLSHKALSYLKEPSEILQTASTTQILLLLLLWLLFSGFFYWLFSRFFTSRFQEKAIPFWKTLVAFLLILPMLFLGARGGLQAIPVSISSAYFSNHQILNLAAVNPLYNITVSILNSRSIAKENIFQSMPDAEARAIVKALHQVEKDTNLKILEVEKPNIVVLLLESWSADLIESLGGEPGITPNFRQLEKEGLLFTNFYANANRSQQAMGSLYGGLPGIPITTITNHPEKYAALPSLSKDLKQVGYQSAFYFGGQLNYGNILSYLIYNEIDKIVEGKDLPSSMPRGKLGVHDGILLPWTAGELSALQQPFFATIFTLSSHAPYDYPMEHVIHWPEIEKPYVNGAYYTDQALGAFFETAKTMDWYDQSLFIIMADHSKSTYRNHPLASFDYHRIPLLFVGPALKPEFKGKQYDRISGNTDIPASLLHQLNLPSEAYVWSKNIFNPYSPEFAFFELNEGLGWKTPEGYFVWDKFGDRYYKKQLPASDEDRILKEGKAYLQVLFGDFIAY